MYALTKRLSRFSAVLNHHFIPSLDPFNPPFFPSRSRFQWVRFASTTSATKSLSEREREVLSVLKTIPADGGNAPSESSVSTSTVGTPDMVFAGLVRYVSEKNGVVSILLPLDKNYRYLKTKCIEEVKGRLTWVKSVEVAIEPAPGKPTTTTTVSTAKKNQKDIPTGLGKVKNIIAVSSCKGGVGKSTTAVNLAYSLALLPSSPSTGKNLRVGILDADVYGPSLPVLTSPKNPVVLSSPQGLAVPVEFQGVKLMSYGFIQSGGAGAIMRGPIATSLITQLATQTEWGELDYLIIDLPPGTGDIHITLAQIMQIRAAIVVTTPQKLSYVDVVKGIDMFDKVHVPVIAVVENMATFTCGSCSTLHRPFGPGVGSLLSKQFGIQHTFEFPMLEDISRHGDAGTPAVLASNANAKAALSGVQETWRRLAQIVTVEAERIVNEPPPPSVQFDSTTGMIVMDYFPTSSPTSTNQPGHTCQQPIKKSKSIAPRELRAKCRCARCIDELTGEVKVRVESIPNDIKPIGIYRRGNYAVAVHWSDGHNSSLYPFNFLLNI